MPKYSVTLPIVGYAEVEVEANDSGEAIEKALQTDFDDLFIHEEYTTPMVVDGNVCYHPMNRVDVVVVSDE